EAEHVGEADGPHVPGRTHVIVASQVDLDQMVIRPGEVQVAIGKGQVAGGGNAHVPQIGRSPGGRVDREKVRGGKAGAEERPVTAEHQRVGPASQAAAECGDTGGGPGRRVDSVQVVEVHAEEVAAGVESDVGEDDAGVAHYGHGPGRRVHLAEDS